MTINLLIKPAGGSCNLHCDYCFYADEMKNRSHQFYGMMETETIRNIIKKTVLNAHEPVAFAFQGGEPTLRGLDFFKTVIQFQKKYNHNHVPISNALQTNGSLLNDEWCRFLHDNHFLVGISLDGTQADHNRYRHTSDMKDTFQTIMDKIQILEKYQVEYNVLTVLTRQTAENIQDIYQFYKENNLHYQQYIPCLDPLGEKHALSPWSLTPDVYGKMLIELFTLWYEDLKKNQQPYIRQFENWIGILAGIPPEACDQRGVCGLQYVVEANGNCYPCDFYMLDDFLLGNFNTNKLADFDQKREEYQFIERSRKVNPECRDCKFYGICRNGCQRMRDFDPNKDTYLNYFCKSYQMFFEACLPQMKEIASMIRRYY